MKKMTAFTGIFLFCLLHSHLTRAQQMESSGLPSTISLPSPQPPAGVVPRLVRFSGVLKDRTGKAANGEVGLTCSLYELPEGGSPLWVESDAVKLDEQGRYTVLLGETFPEGLPLDLFTTGKALWLGVQPQLPGAAEQPRIHVRALDSTPTQGIIPATLFGMHLISKSNWPTVSIGALGKGTEVVWPYVEQTKGVFNWGNLDAWVSKAQSEGVSFFFSPEKVPPWAAADPSSCAPTYPGSSVMGCTSTVANVQDWDDYVTALVTRYKGRIQIYELWNEPDADFTGTMADLVTFTTHEYNIIRAIDPAAFILSPSPCGMDSLLDNWLAAGGPTGVDGISFHAYPWNVPPAPESVIRYVNNIKAIAAKHGLSSKPIWNTEGSWGTTGLTSDAQVAAVARFYLLQWSNGVSRFYWYAWDGGAWGSLWDNVTGPHPAATAYGQVYNWMVGASMTTPCSVDAKSTWTCGFSRPGGYQAQAIWNTATTLSYRVPVAFTQYRDLAGHISPIRGGDGLVMIGAKPILLETRNP